MDRSTASGALFVSDDQVDFLRRFATLPDVSVARTAVAGWHHLLLKSDSPLLGEISVERQFHYDLLIRTGSTGRFLLAGVDSTLVEIMLERGQLSSSVRRPLVRIDKLVRQLSEEPSRYVMSKVNAGVEGFGHALRTAAFWGNDIAEAAIFRQVLPYLKGRRVTLRNVTTRLDVLSVSSHGDVSFPFAVDHRLEETDAALRFLTGKQYLDWDPPIFDGR